MIGEEAIMENSWELDEAKIKLDEVVEKAIQQGPQLISERGVETVVILSMEDYRKLFADELS